MTWDPDLDLEHGVLRNRLKITDPATLGVAEATLTAARLAEVARRPIPGGYDLPHLQHLHWYIAGDVYPFAGRLRSVRLGKGGHAFCPPEELATRAGPVFERAEPPRLARLSRADLVVELTRLMADAIWLHPFREVNGRTIRAFMAQLSGEAGWRMSWVGLDRDRNIDAARSAYLGDRTRLAALLDDHIVADRP